MTDVPPGESAETSSKIEDTTGEIAGDVSENTRSAAAFGRAPADAVTATAIPLPHIIPMVPKCDLKEKAFEKFGWK